MGKVSDRGAKGEDRTSLGQQAITSRQSKDHRTGKPRQRQGHKEPANGTRQELHDIRESRMHQNHSLAGPHRRRQIRPQMIATGIAASPAQR